MHDYDVQEVSISPFELQKADEMFITNVITGYSINHKVQKETNTQSHGKRITGKTKCKG